MWSRSAKVALAALFAACLGIPALAADDEKDKKTTEPEEPAGRVIKSEKEWQKLLTRAQFLVTRMKATEPAFSGRYVHSHVKGMYTCVCCGAKLFSSQHKFESGTGWPSYWRPYNPQNISSAPDFSDGSERVEVECSHCGAHLGHVFNDGPPPTGLRYCINSVALKLVPDKPATSSSKKAKSKDEDKKTDGADTKDDPSAEGKADTKDDSAASSDKPAAPPDEAPAPKAKVKGKTKRRR